MNSSNNHAFCIECGKMTRYAVFSETALTQVKGVAFRYVAFYAYCNKCHKEVYVPEINDMNADARDKAYYKAKEGR